MKKFIRPLFLIVIICILFSFMTGCSLFAEKNEVGEGFTQSTLTLYDGENSTQYVAKYGEHAQITVSTKKGYYLVGYYDAQEGGTKYIDGKGQSLLHWEKSFPTTLYARWSEVSTLMQEVMVFGNEPKDGGFSGERLATIKLSDELKVALKSNSDGKIKIEYTIDLKTGNGWKASPIGMYIKGYESSGSERYEIFTHTPLVGEFSTFTGSVEVPATDFVDGNIFLTVWNTQKQKGSWAYPVFYSRNLTLKISIVAE